MINDIRDKLQIVLNKKSIDEVDVVYILSRTRKILEIDRRKDFKILNFYCNWTLHSQITNTSSIREELDALMRKDIISLSHLYKDFDDEFGRFLKEYKLATIIFQNPKTIIRFHRILAQIHSDTPLIIKTVTERKITLSTNHDENFRITTE